MLLHRYTFGITLAAVFALLPFSSTGCGETACFQWTATESTCPSQEEAMKFFYDPGCTGRIKKIEGDGAFENGLCCYAVTQDPQDRFAEVDCKKPGKGGAGGIGGVGPGPGEGGFGETSTGFGGGPSCLSCLDAVSSGPNPFKPPGPLCPGSDEIFNQLFNCVCGGPCAAACGGNICSGIDIDQACNDCVALMNEMGCGIEVQACAQN